MTTLPRSLNPDGSRPDRMPVNPMRIQAVPDVPPHESVETVREPRQGSPWRRYVDLATKPKRRKMGDVP